MGICNKAREEYREFLTKYLFPLLGIAHRGEDIATETLGYLGSPVVVNGGKVYFSTDMDTVFSLDYGDLTEDNKRLAINILQSFFNVSEYRLTSENPVVKHSYYSEIQKDANYKMAIQKGISNWIVGSNNPYVENLFNILERWSVQTYEGKKVTFGFIINPEARSNFGDSYGNWCDFLSEDFSAVLTDCINSVVELDSTCNFVRYISLTDSVLCGSTEKHILDDTLPYRFSEIIKEHVIGKCVGVFLLNNGDIIVSKDRQIRFVKRNLKWLNFDFNAFRNSLNTSCHKKSIDDKLIRGVFSSVLDVSFAHTGGIISVISDIARLTQVESDGDPILNCCDDLRNNMNFDAIAEKIRKLKGVSGTRDEIVEKEISKRLLKRKVINALIEDKNFIDLDRKLRCELISMDGACIIDVDGQIYSFGAIIKNDSGSSGGGRGAATKKLSQYGMAIKISTDGYIELFVNGELIYSIK